MKKRQKRTALECQLLEVANSHEQDEVKENLEAKEDQEPVNSDFNKPFLKTPKNIILADLKQIIGSGFSIAITYLISSSLYFLNLYFAGRMGDITIIGGIGLGTVLVACAFFNIIYGICDSFVTICGNAQGAENYELIDIYLKKTIIANHIIITFFCLLNCLSKNLLVFLSQDLQTAEIAQSFIWHILPALQLQSQNELFTVQLESHNLFYPQMIFSLITMVFHVFWCYLFCISQNMLIPGIGLSMFITELSLFIIFLIFLNKNKAFKTKKVSWNQEIFCHWKPQLSLICPLALARIVEDMSQEINTLLAGGLSSDLFLAAHIALSNTASMLYCLTEGFCTVITTYIATAMGEKQKQRGKRISGLGICINLFLNIIFIIFLNGIKANWARYFTTDKDLRDIIENMCWMVCVVILLDNIILSIFAVLKAIGKHQKVFCICFVGQYIIGNPISYFLGQYLQFQLVGIWQGIIIGYICMLSSAVYFLAKINWNKQLKFIKDMVEGKLNAELTLFQSIAISQKSNCSANAPISIDEINEKDTSNNNTSESLLNK